MKIEKFTSKAQLVISAAESEAIREQSGQLKISHLLAGLLSLKDGPAAIALKSTASKYDLLKTDQTASPKDGI